jgi:hypothetical protein
MKKSASAVAEISLYGTPGHGYGYIVRFADGTMVGDGELRAWRSCTDAVWLALKEIRAITPKATVLVHHDFPHGPMVAEIAAGSWPYFGELKWTAGPVYVISAEEIHRAAEKEV